MHSSVTLAVSHFDFKWGVKLVAVGAVFTALGLFGTILMRKRSPAERSNFWHSMYGQRGFMFGIAGVGLVVVGIGFLIVGSF